MTQEEAKEYVMTHLPCTMKGVVTLFDTYFHGTVTLDRLVGLNPRTLGYGRLVFYLKFDSNVMSEGHPMTKLTTYLKCFHAWAAFHNFKIERENFEREVFGGYIFWVIPPVEIKEDRTPGRQRPLPLELQA
jgi:hypothetical protein